MNRCKCGNLPTAFIERVSRESDDYHIRYYTECCALTTAKKLTVGDAMDEWQQITESK